jgi:predicted nucleotidyltransferase
MKIAIDIPQAEIEAFCRRHHIRRLALFGSVLRDDFGPDSDVDVLVEFEPGVCYTFKDLDTMEAELAAIFSLPTDLVDKQAIEDSLNYIRRKIILGSAQVIYAEG